MTEPSCRGWTALGLGIALLGIPAITTAHRFLAPDALASGGIVARRADLESKLRHLLPLLERTGFIWVSWPKKASKVSSDITEDVIRDIALPMHLVDVKVCSVDDIWSALKLAIRREHR